MHRKYPKNNYLNRLLNRLLFYTSLVFQVYFNVSFSSTSRRFAAQSIWYGPTSEIGIVALHLIKSEVLEHSIVTSCE